MNKESNKLGRGLSSLLSGSIKKTEDSNQFKFVSITSLKPNKP